MPVWIPFVALVASAFAVAFLLAAAVLPGARRWWPLAWSAPRCQAGCVALAMGAFAAASVGFHHHVAPRPAPVEELGLAQTVAVPGVVVRTDQGTPIGVKRLSEAVAPGAVPDGYKGRLIVAGGRDALSNCHGWVFTDGEFCVDGTNVDDILRENGYTQVVDPQPSDLIVYRDGDGVPIHTGLVQATGRNGFVLVESKWGQLDVYWHTPADQRYADHWEYWRSPRAGHRLDVAIGRSPAVENAPPPPPSP
jgi:hypothetical protein